MAVNKYYNSWIIILSFIASFILTIIPLPISVASFNPAWIAMVLIYWCLYMPERVGINIAWITGIIHDVLTNALLGQHSLFLCLIAYFALKWHKQIRSFSDWQQALIIFSLILINQLLLEIIIYFLETNHPIKLSIIYPAITSMLLWKWLFIYLHDLQHHRQKIL
ncbi:MAG: rod shape-determining protein MreD [Thiomargarita sp.]|nr:rod shape-determining protein MreD [Thiomargarita sp.]